MTQPPKPPKCLKCSGPLIEEYGPVIDRESAAWRRAFLQGMCWVCYRLFSTVKLEVKEDAKLTGSPL